MARRTDDPWQLALDALARRDLTAHEVTGKLLRRKVPRENAGEVVSRLEERGYVDDERVAYNHARFRRDQARRGPRRVLAELVARGVGPELAARAVAEIFPDADRRTVLERAAERLAGVRGIPGDRQGRERLARRLLTAGFAQGDVIAWLADGPADGAAHDALDAHDDVD